MFTTILINGPKNWTFYRDFFSGPVRVYRIHTLPIYAEASIVFTYPVAAYASMALSEVTSGILKCRAVAMIRRSAGSEWNVPGRRTLSTAMAGSIGVRRMPGRARAALSQEPVSCPRLRRPFSDSMAISHGVIADTRTALVCAAFSISACALVPRRGSLETGSIYNVRQEFLCKRDNYLRYCTTCLYPSFRDLRRERANKKADSGALRGNAPGASGRITPHQGEAVRVDRRRAFP